MRISVEVFDSAYLPASKKQAPMTPNVMARIILPKKTPILRSLSEE